MMDFIRAEAELPRIREPRYGSQLKPSAIQHYTKKKECELAREWIEGIILPEDEKTVLE